jgi:tetratricopeptide (TPR) repeat protein
VGQAVIGGGRRPAWTLSPPAIVAAGCALLVAGVGGGVAVGRWLEEGRRALAPVTRPAATAGAGQTALMSRIDLGAFRQAAGSEDAPTPTLLEVAHGALDQGRLDEARSIYQRVLARDPRNVEAITHLGAVLYQEGHVDEALANVEEALRIDLAYIHAHWDRTQYLFYGKRDFSAAVKAAEAFLQVLPNGPDADSVRGLMGEARAQAVKPARRPGTGG